MKHTNYLWGHGGFAVDGRTVWFVSYRQNILCKYNLETQKTEKSVLLSNTMSENDGFITTIMFRQYLILVPSYDNKIIMIDFSTEKKIYFELPNAQIGTNLFQYMIWQEKIYLFPVDYGSIVILEFKRKEKPQVSYIETKNKRFVSISQIDNVAYLVNKTNEVFTFCADNEQLTVVASSKDFNIKFQNIEKYNNEQIILCDSDGNVYKYFLRKRKFQQILLGDGAYYSVKIIGEYLYLFSEKKADEYEIFDLYRMEKKVKPLVFNGVVNNWSGQAFSKATCSEDKLYVMNTFHQCIYEIDIKERKENRYFVKIEGLSENDKKLLMNQLLQNDIMNEDTIEYATLKCFILNIEKKGAQQEKISFGRWIYDNL